MIKNAHRAFICRDQPLAVENVETAWTRAYAPGQVIRVPLKNQDGQYVADERTLEKYGEDTTSSDAVTGGQRYDDTRPGSSINPGYGD